MSNLTIRIADDSIVFTANDLANVHGFVEKEFSKEDLAFEKKTDCVEIIVKGESKFMFCVTPQVLNHIIVDSVDGNAVSTINGLFDALVAAKKKVSTYQKIFVDGVIKECKTAIFNVVGIPSGTGKTLNISALSAIEIISASAQFMRNSESAAELGCVNIKPYTSTSSLSYVVLTSNTMTLTGQGLEVEGAVSEISIQFTIHYR